MFVIMLNYFYLLYRYCEVATSRLGIAIPDEDINSESTLKNLSEWKDVVRFYSLRLLLAPLVETIILLDRLIFLEELGKYNYNIFI